jgi:predicted O-methyltransferase YrrM
MPLSIANRGFRRIAQTLQNSSKRRIVREYLRKCGLSHANGIHTFTTKPELEALLYMALRCPEGARAVEIGSYLGAATCFIAAGLFGRNGLIYCVDTWNNETMPDGTRDTFEEFNKNIAPVSAMIRTVRKPSAELVPQDLETPLHLIFIDGDHNYEAVRSDFNIVVPLLAKDGMIALHDTWYYVGVRRLLGEVLATGQWRLLGHVNNLSWIGRAD